MRRRKNLSKVKRKSLLLLACITLIGVILRSLLVTAGVDTDDVVTEFIASSANPAELLERVKLYEFAPPLYFLFMSAWVHLFGNSPTSLVIPSVVFGAALVPAVYFLAKELFDREDVAFTSAFFMAVCPLAVLFSREVRPSSLLPLLSAVAFLFLIRCLKATRLPRVIGLGISSLLLLYTHYFGLLLIGLMVVNTLAYTRFPYKSVVFKPHIILGTIGGALLLFLPWMPVFIEHQAAVGYWTNTESTNSLPFLFTSNLAATLPIPWNASFVLLTFLLPIWAAVIVWKALRMTWKRELIDYIDHQKGYAFLVANVLIPILGYNYITQFLGNQRYVMSFIVFGLIFWAALAVEFGNQVAVRLARRSNARRLAGVSLLALVLIACTFLEVEGNDGSRSGLEQLAKEWKSKKFNRCAVLVTPDFNSYALLYYLSREPNNVPPQLICTYPVKNNSVPLQAKNYLAAIDSSSVDDVLKWIEQIDITRVQKLVLINDETKPFGKPAAAKAKSEALIAAIRQRFTPLGEPEEYAAKGRSFSVQTFRIAPPPD